MMVDQKDLTGLESIWWRWGYRRRNPQVWWSWRSLAVMFWRIPDPNPRPDPRPVDPLCVSMLIIIYLLWLNNSFLENNRDDFREKSDGNQIWWLIFIFKTPEVFLRSATTTTSSSSLSVKDVGDKTQNANESEGERTNSNKHDLHATFSRVSFSSCRVWLNIWTDVILTPCWCWNH